MEHYLSGLLAIPLLLALATAFLPEHGDRPVYHRFAAWGSGLLFIYSLVPLLGGWPPLVERFAWFPQLGIHYALGMDGISLSLVILTTFLLFMAVIASFSNIQHRLKLYYSMLFVLITAVLGVFISRDLFLFFLFWELELIPMYLLIAIWGGPRRDFAAMKFVLYTLFGSVFLVAGLVGFYFIARSMGIATTDLFLFDSITKTVQLGLPVATQALLFLAFFTTFAIKLPMVPFHTWLPDAHVEAPTPISMLLAGILLKMGAYGMLRLCFEMFPAAAATMVPYIALLALINIVYTAGVALVQADLKKLIAYSSVSHMGFVLLGLAALNAPGLSGAVFVMLSHGVVSAALFMCVGTLYLRTHTRQIADYGGFGAQVPVLFYFFLFMAMASLGLPLLISFAGESLVLYGAFLSNAVQTLALGNWIVPMTMQQITVVSAIGIVIGAAYLLWMLQRVFFGTFNSARWAKLPDATPSEVVVLASLTLLVLAYGIYPRGLTQIYEADVIRLLMPYQQIFSAQANSPKLAPSQLRPKPSGLLSAAKES
jgi:NADH-quinone oxidoreductase subunit M